ncbi:DUF938 domain-containing protein [Pontixanthobacter aquaemixtae]|uniref:DUF938 domain-containing protein n=1 Tax=Pontixanthobacter aquaemixtae TaxID=1958940 RepID=A0A844ZS73_9SPHN|nr:DUF938 domain-containing protein [Pontixanthobacter aquaemixtae]MXO89657.1 DUF938 domain-containing protein [Pontixanthobacter aquaemixtae]
MKRHAPATERNRSFIADVLKAELQLPCSVLEIASGTGEHAVFLAQKFPGLVWQPSDQDAEALASIAAWTREAGLANIRPPIALDASKPWPALDCDAIFCCNMIHISPWSAAEGLFRNAGGVLNVGGPLILYGPFLESDVETAPSNVAFDESLKSRDPAWGIRDIADVDALAKAHGFARSARYAMPANNLMLVYRK